MSRIYTIIISFILLLWSVTELKAQQGTSASAGEAAGIGGTISYTIGQVDYITASGSGGTLSEGVHHPYEIAVVTGQNEKGIKLSCDVFPNPTSDLVVLTIDNPNSKNITWTLSDINGRLITHQKMDGSVATISMSHFADALYLLKVYNNDQEVKSFKIIKNK